VTKHFHLLLIFGFLCVAQVSWAQVPTIPSGEPEAITRTIHSTTGVELIFVVEDGMFPETWYDSEIDAQAESLEHEEVERVLEILERCIAKYPEAIVKENLNRVYVLNSLQFFGTSYGGTYTSDAVFLSDKGEHRGYTDTYIEKLFHAEFSSVLYKNYADQFDHEAWAAACIEGFEYGAGGMQALKTGQSSEAFLYQHNELGFLNKYAQSSMENDFNSFAKNVFCPSPDFWQLTESYDGLGKKLALIIAFYQGIDPQFNAAFFEGLTLEE
jgi:hypothetical protein